MRLLSPLSSDADQVPNEDFLLDEHEVQKALQQLVWAPSGYARKTFQFPLRFQTLLEWYLRAWQ